MAHALLVVLEVLGALFVLWLLVVVFAGQISGAFLWMAGGTIRH